MPARRALLHLQFHLRPPGSTVPGDEPAVPPDARSAAHSGRFRTVFNSGGECATIVHDRGCLFMEPDTARPAGQLNSEWVYQPNPGFYDEMLAADGSVRPHWRHLTVPLEEMGEAG